ncbi:MAG TPA: signal recognition particle protein [candidate division Zixibacteria bacterium]|nr:signal recognition particle protein [candidate division Zixibacteria bacterium]HBY99890.1 signal recognition particle protein [candidate division Zixibacteria bacterium]
MFEQITDKLDGIFKKLTGRGYLSEKNIQDAGKEIRLALLEADVNYKVVKNFVAEIEKKAVGQEVTKSISPGQQLIKIVHDEMVSLLGGTRAELTISPTPPTVILLAGLQGSGKTTLAGKLALYLRKKGNRPLLVAADIHRPAAKKQLEVLADSIQMPFFTVEKSAPEIAKEAINFAKDKMLDIVIVDTAGRLQIDNELMTELADVKKASGAQETLFIADAMTGQEALNVASEFHKRVELTGAVLTKMDGDARGGSAMSLKAALGIPIKFIGTGEKLSDLEEFHPSRIGSRILGMGDIVSLVEKAQEAVDMEEAEKLEKKLLKESFTFEDFLSQLKQLKKMGPLQNLMEMIPGMGKQLKGITVDENGLARVEAIIKSMTKKERHQPSIIDGSRRKRIAAGSGTSVQQVNMLLKQFASMQKMIKQFSRMSLPKGFPI